MVLAAAGDDVAMTIRYVHGSLPGSSGEFEIAILEGDTHCGKWIEEAKRLDHDQNVLPLIARYIGPESVVWDVGAYIGDHTAFYASLAKSVVAFEAEKDAYDCLVHNCGQYGNVLILNVLVGEEGDKALCSSDVGDNEGGNFGARRIRRIPGFALTNAREVVDLDSLPNIPAPTLIKLDIEGWETRALRGAYRILKNHHPVIVAEVNKGALGRAGSSPEELHTLLSCHGYKLNDLDTGDAWDPWDERPQFDIVGV